MLAMFLPFMVTVSILLVLLVTNRLLPIIERYGDVYSVKVCIPYYYYVYIRYAIQILNLRSI